MRGLTIRSFVVTVVALLLMGIWIEYEEMFTNYGGPLGENSPANSAVGVICALIGVSWLLYLVRRSLRLVAAELVVIYAALIIASPLMSQGMWHRIFGLLGGIPHHQDFVSYDALPPLLWPHGDNLIENNRFKNDLEGIQHEGGGSISWQEIDHGTKGTFRSPVLSNDDDPKASATLVFTIPRYDAKGVEQIVPAEPYLFSVLIKADDFGGSSSCRVTMQADDGTALPLLTSAQDTKPTFGAPGGFKRIGVNPVTIPPSLQERLVLRIALTGPGTLAVQDVEFFNMQAVESAFSGRQMVTEANLAKLGEHERNSTVIKPDQMFSLAGLKYLFTGFVPLGQWVRPMLGWGSLVAALFMGFMGLNVVMRRQWVNNERFSFPLTVLPKALFAETTDEKGRTRMPIFRNRVMWLGFVIMLVLALLKGLHFYNPSIPGPSTANISFESYVTSDLAKTYWKGVGIGTGLNVGFAFCLLAIALLIETDVLFSLWATFLLFRFWHLFGDLFRFKRFAGYPWEHQQTMGAYIAYALLAVFVGRHHLAKVFRSVFLGRKEGLDSADEVVSYRKAFVMIAASLSALTAWSIWTGMGAFAGLLFFAYMLMCGFVASRIRAECGAPIGYITPYFGMQFVAAMGGIAVFKSTGMLVAAICSGFMCTACFLLIAPAQVEMMEVGRHFNVRPRDVGAGLTLGMLGGVVVGAFVLLCWLYGFGADNLKTTWSYDQNWYFGEYRGEVTSADRAFASGTVGQNPEAAPLNVIKNPHAKGMGIGAMITFGLAALRSRFVWFPFHPLGYLLASTFFMKGMVFTIFLAWLARSLVLKIGGARSIRHGLVPFAIGMFLACVVSVVFFDIVGIFMRLSGVEDVYCRIP
ncbi:MAG: hypothetical protein QGH42_03920 [Kiritimatiellia bacterium]|nr:hypothetical protein [Kiritimatiellia bacterium]MDP7023383.1 hypothetical protein [Kiritimatiellia bacterium]